MSPRVHGDDFSVARSNRTVITVDAWQQAMYPFLVEKERRSGSRRTVEGYWRMLRYFPGHVGSRPTRSPRTRSSPGPPASGHRASRRRLSASGQLATSGWGRVFVFNVVHQVTHPAYADEVPYVLAMVELEEGTLFPTRIIGCDPSKVSIGLPVEVQYEDVPAAGHTLPLFRPKGRCRTCRSSFR